jgi:hypothetical protein
VHLRFVITLLGAPHLGERTLQAPKSGVSLAGTRFGFGEGSFETGQEPNQTLLPIDGDAASHLGEARLFGTVGPSCPALKKYRVADPRGWEIVSRHDIGHRLAVGRDCLGVMPQEPKQCRECERISRRWNMRCRLGVGEGAVGKAQRLVDSPEHPQCVPNLRCGTGILAEPVDEIGIVRLVVERDGLRKMVMGAGKVAEIKAGLTGNAVCNHRLGTIRPGPGLAQEQLGHLVRRCGFAAGQMPDPKTVIGGKPFRRVFHLARQFAGARKGRARFRRLMSLGPEQRIAEARL